MNDRWTKTARRGVRAGLGVLLLLASVTPGEADAAVQTTGAVSTGTGGGFLGLNFGIAHTVAAGTNRYLLVGVSTSALFGSGPAATVTWNNGTTTQNLTQLGTATQNAQHIALFGLVAPNTGVAGTVTVTGGGFIPVATVAAVNLIGVDQTTPGQNFFSATGNSTTPSVTVCPSSPTGCTVNPGDLVLAGLATTTGSGAVTVAPIAPLQITFDAASSANALTASTLSWSHTIGSANVRKLVVGIAVEADNSATANNCASPGNADVTNVTYNSVALTHIAGADTCVQSANGFMQRIEMWYQDPANLPIGGSYTVQATLAGSVDEIKGGAISLNNAAAGAPQAVANGTVDGTSNTITTNIAAGTANAWLVDLVGAGDAGTFTPGAGQVERLDVNGTSASAAMSTKANISAAANSMTQTHSVGGVNRLAHAVLRIAPHCPAGSCSSGLLWDVSTGGGINTHGVGFAHGGAGATTMSATMATAQDWALGAVLIKKASTITQALIDGVRAWSRGDGAVIEWQTLAEYGTLGFHLERLDPASGRFERINKRMLPGLLHSRTGGIYRYRDRDAIAGESYAYRIIEIEAGGNKRIYGPFAITVDTFSGFVDGGAAADRPMQGYERVLRKASASHLKRIARRKAARAKARKARRNVRRGPGLKLSVKAAGLYRVDAAVIADSLGLTTARVRKLIQTRKFSLKNQGRQIATLSESDGSVLFFYAEPIDSQYTDENVYLLEKGAGLSMQTLDGGSATPVIGQSFPYTSHVEGNRFSLTHLFDDPDADYWMWDFRIGGMSFDDCAIVAPPAPCNIQHFRVPTPDIDFNAVSGAELLVRLHGASELEGSEDHQVVISLNGEVLETVVFDGLSPFEARVPVPVDALAAGENSIEIDVLDTPDAQPMSVVYVNDVEIRYPRLYRAQDAMLIANTAGHRAISIDGFASSDLLLLDLTTMHRPRLVANALVDSGPNGYRISARTAPDAHSVFAIERSRAPAVDSAIVDSPSKLRARRNRADWLLITSADMLEAAAELAAHRGRQGLRTQIVDVEDIYDEFNHGIRSAEAIWAFLRHAWNHWAVAPRYVVLAGEGSHDYKNYLGFGDSVIPTLLTPTPRGLFPSDNLYADVSGNDWIADLAIGRLPVIDAPELAAVVAKLIAYEQNADIDDWGRRVTVSADAMDNDADFAADSLTVMSLIPGEYAVDLVHVDDLGPSEARARMLDKLHDGSAFVNFYGHGGHLSIGNFSPGLLTAADVATLHNGVRLPVVTAFTCLAGQFGFPGQESVSEALLVSADGGAAAVWAPSGLSEHARARLLGEAFYHEAFAAGRRRLGDSILGAQRRFALNGSDHYLLDIYNLIGDPATMPK
jgi:hypothetical protein